MHTKAFMKVDVEYLIAAARLQFNFLYQVASPEDKKLIDAAVVAQASVVFAMRSEATLKQATPDSVKRQTVSLEEAFLCISAAVRSIDAFRALPKAEKAYIETNLLSIDTDQSRESFC